jgi:hypothetical protein
MIGLKSNSEGYNRPFSPAAQSPLPLPSGEPELGDEPAQLHRLAETVEARLRRAQEETEQATQALTQVQGVLVEQASSCRTGKYFSPSKV